MSIKYTEDNLVEAATQQVCAFANTGGYWEVIDE